MFVIIGIHLEMRAPNISRPVPAMIAPTLHKTILDNNARHAGGAWQTQHPRLLWNAQARDWPVTLHSNTIRGQTCKGPVNWKYKDRMDYSGLLPVPM